MGLNPLRIVIGPQEIQIIEENVVFKGKYMIAKRPIITLMKFLMYDSMSINIYL
jgi:hypothetical protein